MADFFAADEILGKSYDARLMRRLIQFIRPYRLLAIVGVLLGFLATGLNVANFFIQGLVVADLNPEKPLASSFLDWLWQLFGSPITRGTGSHLLGLSFLLCSAVTALFIVEIVHYYCLQLFGQKVIYDIRMRLLRHMLDLPLQFFHKNPVGRLVTRVSNDIQALQEFVATGLIDLTRQLLLMVAIAIALLTVSLRLGLISLAIVPLIIVATVLFRHFARLCYRKIRKELATMNAFLAENITGMSIIQLFHREQRQLDSFETINQNLTRSNIASVKAWALFSPTINIFKGISLATVLFFGTHLVLRRELDLATFTIFIWLIGIFFDPIRHLAEKYNMLQAAMASCERIFMVLDTETDVALKITGEKIGLTAFHGAIEFCHVNFGYEPGQPVLHDINLKIAPGEKVALVGHTGAGKSTLIKLLMQFYAPTAGKILVDGVPLDQIPPLTWRKFVAVVPQHVFLFRGNILDNIRLGNHEIDEAQVIAAARQVYADRFIEKYPTQYKHQLEEGAKTLSSGERQLLSFARALAYRPSLLILDEATSLIDTQTERLIQDALHSLLRGQTSIIIAHRLSTIQNADKIVVLHQGAIVEIGTHQELLRRQGFYCRLHQCQTALATA